MKLVFIHGWGLDPSLWDGVSALLPQPQERIDLGFFGARPQKIDGRDALLVGHSLGFMQGILESRDWGGWVAINSFARFIKTETTPGCVSLSEWRAMRKRTEADSEKTLKDFHRMIGAQPIRVTPDKARLLWGLDQLCEEGLLVALDDIRKPSLVLAAQHDPLVPEETSTMLAGNNAILWHKDGGHMLPQSDPAWCARVILDFMRTNFHDAGP